MDVHGFLAALRSRLRRVLVLDGVARTVIAGLVGCALAVGIDYCWPIPGLFRLVLLAALILVISLIIHRRLVRPLGRRMDDRAMAQLAERRLPDLDGRLLTRVDGIELGEADVMTMRGVLTPHVATTLIPARRLPLHISLAAVLAFSAAAVLVAQPRLISDGLNRLFLPMGDTEWERHSALSGSLDRTVVAVDEPLLVRVQRDKGAEAPLRLNWSPQEGGMIERRMLSGLSGPWHQALSLPVGTYRLFAESDDALPLRLIGRVVKRPVLARIDATLTPPAYVAQPPQHLSTLTCSALAGSHLDLTLEFAVFNGTTIVDPTLSFADARLPVSPSTASATSVHARLTVMKSGILSVQVKDQDGIEIKPQPNFTVTVIDDRKPVVSLEGPRTHESVTMRAQVAVKVEASDDYGLNTLQLLTNVLAARGHEDKAPTPAADAQGRSATIDFTGIAGSLATARATTVAIGQLAKEGESVVLVGRASDANNITGPGIGQSEALELPVVSEGDLRTELDHLLTEARNRIEQAMDELDHGIATPARLVATSRSATQESTKADVIIVQVVRRWSENQLTPEQLVPIAKAGEIMGGPVMTFLGKAVQDSLSDARQAQDQLQEAYRLLGTSLQEGNLARLIQSLLERETSLNKETKSFVNEHLLGNMDDAAKTREANLAQRQSDLADQARDIERRILGDSSKQMEQPQEIVRNEAPADQMKQAGDDLTGDHQRGGASGHQDKAIASLAKILNLLHGSDANGDLLKQLQALTERQLEINDQLQRGTPPPSLAAEQAKLARDTKQFAAKLDKNPKAAKLVDAATSAQGDAGKAMSGDDASGASREGGAAASLLKQAQSELDDQSEEDKKKEKEKAKQNHDVVALLKELSKLQVELIADSNVTFKRLGEKALDFTGQREVPAFAGREGDILLRLREEGLKYVEKMPIVVVAIQRVMLSLDRTQQHLATPALGQKGMTLEKIALWEIDRLIAIAETQTDPDKKDAKPGKGNGGGDQAPFPPEAQLSLLAEMEAEVGQLTATDRPADLPAMQHAISSLVDLVLKSSPPGSRPHQLLQMSLSAMNQSAEHLTANDHGATTRNEQALAEAALRRLLAEAKGAPGKGKPKNPPEQKGRKGDPAKSADKTQGKQSGSAPGNPKGTKVKPGEDGAPQQVAIDANNQQFGLNLAPERREELKQAQDPHLSSAARNIFTHYLELLGDSK